MKNHLVTSIFENFSKIPNQIGLSTKDEKANVWVDHTWLYANQKIHQIAYSLLNSGIVNQEKIAIFSQNKMEWILTDVAIMSIGAVTVPIYATNILKQTKYAINDANIKVLFAGDDEQYKIALEILNDNDNPLEQIIVFNNDVELTGDKSVYFEDYINHEISDNIKEEFKLRFDAVKLEDLATLVYTSGTTGEPKGVMLTHNNIISGFRIHDIRLTNVSSNDSSLCFLPLSHIFERMWTLYCLHKGIKVSFLNNPKLIIETLKDVKPTLFCTVPRIYEKVYNAIQNGIEKASKSKKKIFEWSIKQGKEYYELERLQKKIPKRVKARKAMADKLVLKKIREVLGGKIRMSPTAGAPMSTEITEFLRSVGIPVFIGYGLSETTASVTAFEENNYTYGSVGKPMPEVEVKIGAQNEILIKGPIVMKGYYNKSDATAEVFEDGWFKSGDAGKLNDDGSLVITDRLKDLMKTAGGKYIAPQQIESLLTDDNFIEQAMVIGDEKPYVTAFVVPNFEALKEYASSIDLSWKSIEDLVSLPNIKEFYDEKLAELQKELAGFEKIKKFKLMPKEFTLEKGELTPTLKIRRKIIVQKCQDAIHDFYNKKEDNKNDDKKDKK